jgi:hypothetical protein
MTANAGWLSFPCLGKATVDDVVLILSGLSAGLHASNSYPNGIGLFDQFDEHHAVTRLCLGILE